jgi:cbb3-type cytochrome oxidase maturation protein
MEVLILTTFVSVLLAAGGVGLFVWSVKARTFDHSERLAILPLEDAPTSRPTGPRPPAPLEPHSPEKQSS